MWTVAPTPRNRATIHRIHGRRQCAGGTKAGIESSQRLSVSICLSLPSGFKIADPTATAHGGATPDELIGRLGAYARLGVDHVALAFPMPDLRTYLRQLELFATDVLPAVHA